MSMSWASKLRSSPGTPIVSSTFNVDTDLFSSSKAIPAPEFQLAAAPIKTSVSCVMPTSRKSISS